MDGGAIAVAGDRIVSTWRRGQDLFLVDGRQQEQRLGTGEQPTLTLTAKGPYVTWLSKRGASLLLLKPGSAKPQQLAARAADPVITSGLNGIGPVVAVWEVRDGQQRSIQCQVFD
jgi:hypothetical protein